MSCYLTIYKNKEFIATYCRNTFVYDALSDYAKFDDTVEFNPKDRFKQGIENLKDQLDVANKQIDRYKLALSAQLSCEDALSLANTISEIKEDIDDIEYAIHEIRFMLTMAEDSEYMRENKDIKDVWTWSLG